MTNLLQIAEITDEMAARLKGQFTVHRPSELPDIGTKITHVLTDGHLGVPAQVLSACPNLKMISSYGVGYDAIDTDACVERGIIVTHTPDVLNEEVATTAVLLMLTCYRELLRDEAYVRRGEWEAKGNSPLTRSADGQTIGILGMGRIGQAIARKLLAFDATVLYHTRSPKDVPYEHVADLVEMAKRVDCLIVITPGGPATKHLVNRDVIEALGPQGTLINVARGSVVDEAETIAALQDGRLGWAGLDVFEDEPRVPQALRELSNVVLLPHVGSATIETRRAMGNLTIDNLLSHQKDGSVLTPVPECKHLAP